MIKIVPLEILTQFFFFLVSILILNFLVFRPILRILNAREAKVTGLKNDIERLTSEFESKKSEYYACLNDAYQVSSREKESLIKKANHEKDTMIANARKESNQMILDIKIASEKQMIESKDKIDSLSDTIANTMIKKLLNE